jgi:hypothetical protein
MNMATKKEEDNTPFAELCHFADEHKLTVELEKPFEQMENLFLLVKKSGEVVQKITINDIEALNKEAAKALKKLEKDARLFKP